MMRLLTLVLLWKGLGHCIIIIVPKDGFMGLAIVSTEFYDRFGGDDNLGLFTTLTMLNA